MSVARSPSTIADRVTFETNYQCVADEQPWRLPSLPLQIFVLGRIVASTEISWTKGGLWLQFNRHLRRITHAWIDTGASMLCTVPAKLKGVELECLRHKWIVSSTAPPRNSQPIVLGLSQDSLAYPKQLLRVSHPPKSSFLQYAHQKRPAY